MVGVIGNGLPLLDEFRLPNWIFRAEASHVASPDTILPRYFDLSVRCWMNHQLWCIIDNSWPLYLAFANSQWTNSVNQIPLMKPQTPVLNVLLPQTLPASEPIRYK